MDRNFLVIGAPNEGNSGSTFVYEEQTTNSWKLLEPIITPNDGDGFDDFGHSVDLDNNNLIVGSPYAATSKLGNAGRVYHYLLNPSTGAVLSSSIEAFASVFDTTGLYFGRSVSISGNFLLVVEVLVPPEMDLGRLICFIRITKASGNSARLY